MDADKNITTDTSLAVTYLEFEHYGDSIPNGRVEEYTLDGRLQWEGEMLSVSPFVMNGHCIWYHENRLIKKEGNLVDGNQEGVFSYYQEKGQLLYRELFQEDTLIFRGYNIEYAQKKFSIDTLRLLVEYEKTKHYTKAIQLFDEYVYMREKRGDSLRRRGKPSEARNDYEKCLKLDHPHANNVYQKVARTYQDQGKIKEAQNFHHKAIQHSSETDSIVLAESYFEIGRLYLREKNYSEAISSLSKAIELRPNVPEYFSSRAWSYMNWDRTKYRNQASEDAQTALQLNPKNSDALGFLALIEVEKGNYLKGLEYAQRGRSYDPSNEFVAFICQSLEAKNKIESIPYSTSFGSQIQGLNWINTFLLVWEFWDYFQIAKQLFSGSFLKAAMAAKELAVDAIIWQLIEKYVLYFGSTIDHNSRWLSQYSTSTIS
ncbi:MAG: tetratricopeptide repeat protein [Cyanobacteria bacterium J06649_11]